MTKEEIIQAISDDKMMPYIQPEQLAGIVDFVIKNYQPSLPPDLDEAAEKYADIQNKNFLRPEIVKNIFKAGAKWLARQGVTCEGKVFTSAFTSYVKTPGIEELLKDAFPEDTEVIVQIRKK